MGIAVLDNGHFLDYAVKTFRKRKGAKSVSLKKRLELTSSVLPRFIHRYEPQVLAVELPSTQRQKLSPYLRALVPHLQKLAKAQGLQYYECTSWEIRKSLCGQSKATRNELANKLCQEYREFRRFAEKRTAWQVEYWNSLFCAASIALTCAAELERQS
jgi:Holliday junction resolvasome RuvABC endonuclease subunit